MSNADAVRALTKKEKVDLLAQALLREYMHRRGFKKTLSKFDEEVPRTENTISSRNLMSELMNLEKLQLRNKAAGTGQPSTVTPSKPLSSIMELLCSYRLRKRFIRHRDQEKTPTETLLSDSSDEDRAVRERWTTVQKAKNDYEKQMEVVRQAVEQKKLEADEAKRLKKLKKLEEKQKEKEQKKGNKPSVLTAAMTTLEVLPVSSSGSARAYGIGRNWTPGGDKTINVPEVGLNAKSVADSGRPPSFVAGAGFSLMANTVQADPHQQWEIGSGRPVTSRLSTSSLSSNGHSSSPFNDQSPTHGGHSTDDEPVPSPYNKLGKTVYDPGLKATGILQRKSGGSGYPSSNPAVTQAHFANTAPTIIPNGGATAKRSVEKSDSPSPTGQRKGRKVTILAD